MTHPVEPMKMRADRSSRPGPGPGNAGSAGARLVFFCVDNLGDMLCTTPVVRAFRRRNPDAFLAYVTHNAGYCRVLDGNPDLDLVLYREDLSVYGPGIADRTWLESLPLPCGGPLEVRRFDVLAMLREDALGYGDHISRGFARIHGVELESIRPVLALSAEERALAAKLVQPPYVVFGMHAGSPVPSRHGELTRKEWVFDRWLHLARRIRASSDTDIVAIGSAVDPQVGSRHFRSLYGLPIKVAAAVVAGAACVITVEGGLSHICHAVDAPTVLIFSRDVSFPWAYPGEASRCRVIYDDPRSITYEEVIAEMAAVMAGSPASPAAPPR